MMRASWPTLTQNLLVLDTRKAILDLAPLLEELAERCGQAGAMHWLPYFLDKAVMTRRTPFLVLVLRPEQHQGRSFSVEEVEAAALFFEYRVFGLRTGAVATGDAVGFNSVIAPQGQRALVAARAARVLVERGASIVLATYEGEGEPEPKSLLTGWPGVMAASRERRVGRMLPLLSTLEDTLAQMSKSTRANLRYYRRRLERELGCEYVPDAATALIDVDLQALNASSLNPLPAREFKRRVRCAAQLPGSFLSGLRTPDGRWLSLVGGWRQEKTTVLHWQMNSAGFERQSIGTGMRSFLLEHEIALGATRLLIYGGTPHPMRHAFVQDTVADLVVRRKGVQALALCWTSRLFATPGGVLGSGNFLARLLQDPGLEWVSSAPASTPARLLGRKPIAASTSI